MKMRSVSFFIRDSFSEVVAASSLEGDVTEGMMAMLMEMCLLASSVLLLVVLGQS